MNTVQFDITFNCDALLLLNWIWHYDYSDFVFINNKDETLLNIKCNWKYKSYITPRQFDPLQKILNEFRRWIIEYIHLKNFYLYSRRRGRLNMPLCRDSHGGRRTPTVSINLRGLATGGRSETLAPFTNFFNHWAPPCGPTNKTLESLILK